MIRKNRLREGGCELTREYERLRTNALGRSGGHSDMMLFMHKGMKRWLASVADNRQESTTRPVSGAARIIGMDIALTEILADAFLGAAAIKGSPQ